MLKNNMRHWHAYKRLFIVSRFAPIATRILAHAIHRIVAKLTWLSTTAAVHHEQIKVTATCPASLLPLRLAASS